MPARGIPAGIALCVLLAGCVVARDDATPQSEAAMPAPAHAAPTPVDAVPAPPAPDPDRAGAANCQLDESLTAAYSAALHGERLTMDAGGVGPVRLGMTVDAARVAMPGVAFVRSPDAEGIAFVGLMRGDQELMSLYTGEDDPDAPIDGSRRIRAIQSFHPAVAVAGIAAGDAVARAEAEFGAVRAIVESEIESRQYVTFARQPEWLTVRIDYSGDFEPGSRTTTRYCPGARILSLDVAAPGPGDDDAP